MRRADARIASAVGGVALIDGREVSGVFQWDGVEDGVGEHTVVQRTPTFACNIADLPAGTVKRTVVEHGGRQFVIQAFDPPGGDDTGHVRLVLSE